MFHCTVWYCIVFLYLVPYLDRTVLTTGRLQRFDDVTRPDEAMLVITMEIVWRAAGIDFLHETKQNKIKLSMPPPRPSTHATRYKMTSNLQSV